MLTIVDDPQVYFGTSTVIDGNMALGPTKTLEEMGEAYLAKVGELFAPVGGRVLLAFAEQIHGAGIASVSATRPTLYRGVDGLVTDSSSVGLVIRGADCPPVLIHDRKLRRLAFLHSGRKGTEFNIAARAVEMMRSSGSDPENLEAWVGPGICSVHYPVEAMAAEAFLVYGPSCVHQQDGKFHLNLVRIIQKQLLAAGLSPDAVRTVSDCTFESAELLSYRKDIANGTLKQGEPARVQAFVACMR